jgi:hypothetical protein
MMNARDSFDAPPPRDPGRVRRVDIFLSVREVDVPAVLDEEGVEVTPATTELQYVDSYQFHRPDNAGGSDEYCAGPLRPHLTATRKGHLKGLLDWALLTANGE